MSKRVLMIGLLLGLMSGCGQMQSESQSSAGRFRFETPVMVDRFVVEGAEPVTRDEITDPELAAACQTLNDWQSDHVLGLGIILSDDAGLLRSAELLAGEFAHSAVARAAEQRHVEGEDTETIVSAIAESDGEAASVEARRYLDARASDPSPSAATKFVVYLAPRTTTQLLVVRLAVEPRIFAKLHFLNRGVLIEIARTDGKALAVDPAFCSE